MDFQVPLLIIDRKHVSIMSTYFLTHRITHLRFNVARVVMRYFIMLILNIVRSLE
jgi:hypothetical protein